MKKSFYAVLLVVLTTCFCFGQERYQLRIGDQFKVMSTANQVIEQTMFGQIIETNQTIVTIDLYEVVDIVNDNYRIKIIVISRSLKTESPGSSVTMDSDLDGAEHLAFRLITDKSYYVTMNPYGKVVSIDGIEEMAKQVEAEAQGTALEGSTEEIMSSFEEEVLSNAFEGLFFIYKMPEIDWNRTTSAVVNNLPIEAQINFARTASNEISATGPMTIDGSFETMGQKISAEMSGDQTSIFTLDPKTGLALKIKSSQDMEGNLEMAEMTLQMKMKTSIETTITK